MIHIIAHTLKINFNSEILRYTITLHISEGNFDLEGNYFNSKILTLGNGCEEPQEIYRFEIINELMV